MENAVSPPKKAKRCAKSTPYRKVRLNLYLTEQEATDYAEEAAKVGLRSKNAKLINQVPHGGAWEGPLYNTKGISKFIRKFLFPAWIKSQVERFKKLEQARALAEEAGGRVEI